MANPKKKYKEKIMPPQIMANWVLWKGWSPLCRLRVYPVRFIARVWRTFLEAISKSGFWFNKPEAYKDQGGAEFQAAGIQPYVGDLKRGTNTEIGPKDLFEMACNASLGNSPYIIDGRNNAMRNKTY